MSILRRYSVSVFNNSLFCYIVAFSFPTQICDLDNDGLLNDMELNAFQQWCFNTPLQPQVLEDVKAVLSKNICDGICNGCVTMKGTLLILTCSISTESTDVT